MPIKRKKSTIKRVTLCNDCKECMRQQFKERLEDNRFVKDITRSELNHITLLQLHDSIQHLIEFGKVFQESKLITDISKANHQLFTNIDHWFDDVNKILIMAKELKNIQSCKDYQTSSPK